LFPRIFISPFILSTLSLSWLVPSIGTGG
jgi:hypothetical protein